MVVHRFAETPPLPSYLIALAVGPYESTELDGLGVPSRLITTADNLHLTRHARQVTPVVLQALEGYFDMDYPYRKFAQVAVTEHAFGAMENNGLATFGETVLLLDPETAQPSDLADSTDLIAHELAHHWFGNLVTMKWWNDLWLNEAFATWLAAKTDGSIEKALTSLKEAAHETTAERQRGRASFDEYLDSEIKFQYD